MKYPPQDFEAGTVPAKRYTKKTANTTLPYESKALVRCPRSFGNLLLRGRDDPNIFQSILIVICNIVPRAGRNIGEHLLME